LEKDAEKVVRDSKNVKRQLEDKLEGKPNNSRRNTHVYRVKETARLPRRENRPGTNAEMRRVPRPPTANVGELGAKTQEGQARVMEKSMDDQSLFLYSKIVPGKV
jgi:hypothetical protein